MIQIIGNGDIAKVLKEVGKTLADNRLYYASGVSNPNETRDSEFLRERKLLKKQRKDLQIVYFSTLSIHNPEKRYAQHKIEMEELVKHIFPHWAIARLGIITWGTNPTTTINFLKGKVERGEPFQIRDVSRDVLTKEDFIREVNKIPLENRITELHGRIMTEQEIFDKYVKPKK